MNINYYNPYVRQELELYHHGILGQRWGKKNGPPYPLGVSDHSASEKKAGWRKSLDSGGQTRREARKYTRKLNRLDKDQVEYAARYQRAMDKATKLTLKANDVGTKQGYSKKYRKIQEKLSKTTDKAGRFEKRLKDSEAETWKTVAELSEKGYSMDSQKIKRMALQGEMLAGYYIAGLAGYAVVAAKNRKYSLQEGNKFKVRKTEDGEQQHTRIEQLRKDPYKELTGAERANKSQAYKDFKAESDAFFKKSMAERVEIEDKAEEAIYKNDAKARQLRKKTDALENKYYKQVDSPFATREAIDKTWKQYQAAVDANYKYLNKKRVENMRNSGASYAEIAKRLGIGESMVSYYLNS